MEDVLIVPLDIIKASRGFAIDIGGSAAKVIYRSKEDFTNGEPKDKELAESGRGRLRVAVFTREEVDAFISFIAAHCDLTPPRGDDDPVYGTGSGSNMFKDKLQDRLNVQLSVPSEFECCVRGVSALLQHVPKDNLFLPLCQEGVELAKPTVDSFKLAASVIPQIGDSTKPTFIVKDEAEPYDRESDDCFPCMVIMCGSNVGVFRVEADGTFEIISGTDLAGRFFLGANSLMTGVTDIDEVCKMLKEGDGATVDTFSHELVKPDGKFYGNFGKVKGRRLFPFGKALSDKRDEARKEDMTYSLLLTTCKAMAEQVYYMCRLEGVPRAYYCGTFTTLPQAQTFLTETMVAQQHRKGQQINFEFIKHGGHVPAFGAFVTPYCLQQAQTKTATDSGQ